MSLFVDVRVILISSNIAGFFSGTLKNKMNNNNDISVGVCVVVVAKLGE